MSVTFGAMCNTIADTLDATGEVDLLSVSITPRRAKVNIGTPAGDIPRYRSTVDRIARALGASGKIHTEPFPWYGVIVDCGEFTLCAAAFAAAPKKPLPVPQQPRSTTTQQVVPLLRELGSWLDTLDPKVAHTALIVDHRTHLDVTLFATDDADPDGAAEKLASGLPVTIERQSFGAEGQAILPSGHILHITTI